MWDTFKAELLRFRAWAIAYAALQIIVLGFMTRMVDMAQQPRLVYEVIGAVYGLSGLLLGLYQIGGYRRQNTWLNLLHRPLPHWQVATALFGAGAVALLIAVLLPLLVIAGWQEFMTTRVVDQRHLLLSLSGWLVSLCAYLAGAYAMLANKRYGYAGLALLLLLFFARATGLGAIAVQAIVLVVLAAMVRVAFKPDLGAASPTVAGAVLTAAPLQAAMWLVLVMLGFGVEFLWIAQGSHPNNRAVPLAGGEKETENAEGKDILVAGLKDSRDPEAPLWREQAQISEVFGLGPFLREMPVRDQLTNIAPMEFDDETRRVRWVFSHDRMRFEGYSLLDRRAAGSLGLDGDARFPDPVMPGPEGTLVSRGAVYQYDSDQQRVLPRMRLPAGEQITGYAPAGDGLALLSNRALYFYELRDFADGDGLLQPRQRVPLPGRTGDLQRIDLIELLDGYLVSFLFTRSSYNAEGAVPFQQMLRVDDHGKVTPIARRDLVMDYPPVWRFQNWYPSPPIYELQCAAVNLFSGYQPDRDNDRPPVPDAIRALAVALMLLSLIGAVWRTRRTALSRPARIAWIVACGSFSVPALMSLWLIHPRRETLDDVPLAHAATA